MSKRCPRCGVEYPDSDNFCMECGVKLKRDESVQEARIAKVSKKMGEGLSELQDSVRLLEDELGGLKGELKELKAREPPEDTELLKSAAEGNAKRISSVSSRVRKISRDLDESEKHLEGIENILANFAKKPELEGLKRSVSARFAARTREQNERLDELEGGVRNELNTFGIETTKNIEAELGSATERTERLEAQLSGLITGLEKSTSSKLEGFKTGFNKKLDNSLLELRNEVAQKTEIVNNIRINMEEQIRLNEGRYAGFESRIGEQLDSINNLKEGLAVQQGEKMKEFQTLLLEKVGEIKESSKGIGAGMEERLKASLSGQAQANAKEIVSLKESVGGIKGGISSKMQANGQEIKRLGGNILRLSNLINEGKITKQIEANIKEIVRLKASLSGQAQANIKEIIRLKESVGGIKGGILGKIQANTKEIVRLKARLSGKMQANGQEIKRLGGNILRLSNLINEGKITKQIKNLGKLEEDLIIHQHSRAAALEEQVKSGLEAVRQEGQNLVSSLNESIKGDVGLNSAEIAKLGTGLEGMKASVSRKLRNIKSMENALLGGFVKKEELAGLVRREEIQDIDNGLAGLNELKGSVGNALSGMEKLREDLVLQQESKLLAMESGMNSMITGLRQEAEKSVKMAAGMAVGDIEEKLKGIRRLKLRLNRLSATEKKIGDTVAGLKGLRDEVRNTRSLGASALKMADVSRAAVNGLGGRLATLEAGLGELKSKMGEGPGKWLEERFDALEVSGQDARQQLSLMKEFMENLENRTNIETDNLAKRLDEISRIQEKQELKILTPRTENISRVIKTQIKNEVRALEGRILKKTPGQKGGV